MVWQGSAGDRRSYADQTPYPRKCLMACTIAVEESITGD